MFRIIPIIRPLLLAAASDRQAIRPPKSNRPPAHTAGRIHPGAHSLGRRQSNTRRTLGNAGCVSADLTESLAVRPGPLNDPCHDL